MATKPPGPTAPIWWGGFKGGVPITTFPLYFPYNIIRAQTNGALGKETKLTQNT